MKYLQHLANRVLYAIAKDPGGFPYDLPMRVIDMGKLVVKVFKADDIFIGYGEDFFRNWHVSGEFDEVPF